MSFDWTFHPREFAKFLLRFLNLATLGGLSYLLINFLYQQWPLTWNPVFDFLFTRTGGPVFYDNHIASALAIMAVTIWFVRKSPHDAFRVTVVIFATVSIHELILDVMMGPLTRWQALNGWIGDYSPGFFVLNVRWAFWLSLFLVGGLLLANRKQRRTLGMIAAVVTIYVLCWLVFLALTGHSPWTTDAYAPGPMFFDPIDNAIEIAGWMIPLSVWFWG